MRLVDTSAWIEWLIGSPTGVAFAPLIPDRGDWLVPTMIQLELERGVQLSPVRQHDVQRQIGGVDIDRVAIKLRRPNAHIRSP